MSQDEEVSGLGSSAVAVSAVVGDDTVGVVVDGSFVEEGWATESLTAVNSVLLVFCVLRASIETPSAETLDREPLGDEAESEADGVESEVETTLGMTDIEDFVDVALESLLEPFLWLSGLEEGEDEFSVDFSLALGDVEEGEAAFFFLEAEFGEEAVSSRSSALGSISYQ